MFIGYVGETKKCGELPPVDQLLGAVYAGNGLGGTRAFCRLAA